MMPHLHLRAHGVPHGAVVHAACACACSCAAVAAVAWRGSTIARSCPVSRSHAHAHGRGRAGHGISEDATDEAGSVVIMMLAAAA